MIRFLIYFFPALMDVVVGTVFFVTAVRYSEVKANPMLVTGVMATWALVYSPASILMGRLVTTANAAKLLIWGSGGLAVVSLGYVVVPGLGAQFFWTALLGFGCAMFFTPFQVFMKCVEQGREGEGGVVKPTALYTFAWSFGMACGAYISGNIWHHFGWRWCYWLNALFCVVVSLGVWVLAKAAGHPRPRPIAVVSNVKPVDYSKMPDLAWLGWLASGVGCITVAVVRTIFPLKGVGLDLSKADIGNALAIVSFVQAFVGLSFYFSKSWMYKPVPVALFSAAGILGLLFFGLGGSVTSFYVAAVLYGVYSGMFFFYLVFHSLAHPTKSAHYVSINEAVVGVTSVIGPVLGGGIAAATNSSLPFVLIAVVVALVAAFQYKVHRKSLQR